MLKCLTSAIVAAAAFGGLAVQGAPASAMPMVAPAPAMIAQAAPAVVPEQVRWVCGPYRCFHRPGFYGPRDNGPHFYHPRYYGPRFYHPHHRWHPGFYGHRYGWHHWHRWHHWS